MSYVAGNNSVLKPFVSEDDLRQKKLVKWQKRKKREAESRNFFAGDNPSSYKRTLRSVLKVRRPIV
jgi:hypothetical protein